MQNFRLFERLSRELRRRIFLMIGRAVLKVIDDSKPLQIVQVQGLLDETIDGAERFQIYGLTSHPKPGADALLLAVGGMREHSVVLVDDRRHRLKDLAEGEVALYTDEDEPGNLHRVVMKRGRVVEIGCGTTVLKIEPAGMTLTTPSGTQNWGT